MIMMRILMLGPSLTQNGGIATLENHILKYAPATVTVEHIATHDEGSVAYRGWVFTKALTQFFRKLIQQPPDVIHLHLSERGSVFRKIILTRIARSFKKPVIIHTNGAEFHLFFSQLPAPVQATFRNIFQCCTFFIVLSQREQELYQQTLGLKPEQIFILPNSVEIPPEVPGRQNRSQITLAFCGRIGARKGVFDLIQAYSQLPPKLQNCSQLILAGDGEIERAKALISQLNLTEKIQLTGWINPEEMKQLLSKSDIFILPSYNEGLPLALLEAMGWSLPVITTPVAAIPDIVKSEKNGLLVQPGDVKNLYQSMALLIENESLRLSLGMAARSTVLPLEVHQFWYNLIDIYQHIIKNTPK